MRGWVCCGRRATLGGWREVMTAEVLSGSFVKKTRSTALRRAAGRKRRQKGRVSERGSEQRERATAALRRRREKDGGKRKRLLPEGWRWGDVECTAAAATATAAAAAVARGGSSSGGPRGETK